MPHALLSFSATYKKKKRYGSQRREYSLAVERHAFSIIPIREKMKHDSHSPRFAAESFGVSSH